MRSRPVDAQEGAEALQRLRSGPVVHPGSASLAFELGAAVRGLRERRGWSQSELARAAGMTQSAMARFEAGGTVPTLPVLERLARALDADLAVRIAPRTDVA